MLDLKTSYMGLSLKNPLVVGSSSLTGHLAGVKKCAASGAGAIVLKSLFEEQIAAEAGQLGEYAEYSGHGEATDYLHRYGMELGPSEYVSLVRQAKQETDVPIIPSLNCLSEEKWLSYAAKLERAGADALELNVAWLPTSAKVTAAELEARYCKTLQLVKQQLSIPVAMKIGPYFTSFANLGDLLGRNRTQPPPFGAGWCGPASGEQKIVWHAADSLVLFNRFYQFDIDIDQLELTAGNPYSTSDELHTPLRWVSLLAGRLDSDLAVTSGVHNGADVIKALLAGATVTQLCSTLFQNGLEQVGRILEELTSWMERHGFKSLEDFRGRLSQEKSASPEQFERLQYIKLFVGVE